MAHQDRPSGLHRRSFLRRAAVAAGFAAFPTIVPARAFGAAERVRLGFIGVRNRGSQNLEAFLKQDTAEVVALCDVDREVLAGAREKVEKRLGHTLTTAGDYRRLLEAPGIDAIVVSTPDHWHALQTIDACNAGKDVYCEKPLSLTITEGKAMVATARHANRIVQTGSQQRSDAKFRLACELVRNGRLGRLRTVKVGLPEVNFAGPAVADSAPPAGLDYDFWLGPAPLKPYNEKHVHYLFRFFWDYSGGQMTNFGAHHLDIAQWALGRDDSGPVRIEGSATYHPEKWYEVPMTSRITYTYDDGVKVLCEQGTGARGGCTFEGTEGTLYVTRGKIEANPKEALAEPLRSGDVRLEVSDDHYAHFLDCVKTRHKPITDVSIGHRSATVCHLGNIAARVGRPLTWDPVKETIVGDTEALAMLARPYRAPWALPEDCCPDA